MKAYVVMKGPLEAAVLRLRGPVLRQDDRLMDVIGQAVEQTADCVQSTPRRADHDELVHLTRLCGRSVRPSRSLRNGLRTA